MSATNSTPSSLCQNWSATIGWWLCVFLCFTSGSLLAHGDLHEQIAQVTKALETNDKDAVLYHKRGELHRAHTEYTEALLDYAMAEKLAPHLDVVFLSRGRTLFESGKYSASLESLNTFLDRQPDHVQARWLRGQVFVKLDKRTNAENDFRAALESTEEPSPDQFIERAQNLRQAGQTASALAALEDGIKRLGPLITLELTALELERSTKTHNAALERINRILLTAERKETYLLFKGDILIEMGRKSSAKESYLQALKAIDALPERQRKLRSIAKLESDLRSRLAMNSP